MNAIDKKATDYASLVKEVATLAWPAIMRGLLMTIVFLVDRLMLGHYDSEALASMQVSGPLLWSVFMVFTAFSSGAIAVVGRSVGAGDAGRTQRALRVVLYFSVLIGAVVALGGFAGKSHIAGLMTGYSEATEVIRSYSDIYLGIVFPFSPIYFFGILGFTVLQASGDTRTPLYISTVSQVVNISMNWIFIFGNLGMPELGIGGAAIGTLSAFSIQGCMALYVLLKRKHIARFIPAIPDREDMKELRAVMKVSGPAFLERIIFHSGFIVFASLVGRLGDAAMAANQALLAIESIGFITSAGFAIASGALVSQKLGAQEPERANDCAVIATLMAVAVLMVVAMVFVIFPKQLVGMFISDSEIVALGAQCLIIAALAQPFMAVTDVIAGSLRGAGDTRNPMIAAIAGPVIVRVFASWLMAFPLGMGLYGVWIGSTMDWIVRSIWLAWVFKKGKWKSIKV